VLGRFSAAEVPVVDAVLEEEYWAGIGLIQRPATSGPATASTAFQPKPRLTGRFPHPVSPTRAVSACLGHHRQCGLLA